MNRKLVILSLIIVFIPFVTAFDLSDFPQPFIKNKEFNVVGVIGAKSQDLDVLAILKVFDILTENYNISWRSRGCPEGYVCTNLPIPPYEIKSDEDISNISKNIISIGGPCANKITAQIMSIPTSWPECAEGFKNGTGRIILYNKWNKTQLVIAGFSAEDTKKAANVISKYNEFNLSGYEIEIFDEINNPKLIKLTEKYNEWYKREDSNVNFNHPYVKWLIDKKGSGTFNLYITTTPDILIEGKQELRKFGNVNAFSCSESANQCYVYLQINNFDSIKDLFRIYYVEDISFLEIFSDYQLNVSLEEMKKCDKDEDCVLVSDGCCSCGFKSINKKYKDLWNTKLYCRRRLCIQRVCTIDNNPKCISNQCT